MEADQHGRYVVGPIGIAALDFCCPGGRLIGIHRRFHGCCLPCWIAGADAAGWIMRGAIALRQETIPSESAIAESLRNARIVENRCIRFSPTASDSAMKMDEFRRQIQTIQWPVILRVDGREIAVNSRDEVMIPPAGDLVCIYHSGAFDVIDCNHVSIIHRESAVRGQPK